MHEERIPSTAMEKTDKYHYFSKTLHKYHFVKLHNARFSEIDFIV